MEKKTKNQPSVQVEKAPSQPEKQRPIHEEKLPFNGGVLSGAVWRHQNDQGKPWYSVSLSRGHKNATTGQWRYGESFSRDELLGLVCVIQKIHSHIVNTLMKEATND